MSVTEDIKARLDIANYISQYTPLKKAGRNYTALCPFHSERTPSFVVFPESQTWRCFGACGEGGDLFKFVMKREGLDFPSALRQLADQAGVQLQERTPEQLRRDEQLEKLRALLQITVDFYHQRLLNGRDADPARAYVSKRGLNALTVEQFAIGYAPKDWRQILDYLNKQGYSDNDAVEAGVAIRNDEGRVYDRFRNRLMIPIHDGRGRVIGFGARALDPKDEPKYLNSPQSALFDKSATLFALDKARRLIRESETAVIVEGYMDAIQAHQSGFSNVVAQMGTALTEPQIRQLGRYARRLILALDPDAAGAKATMRDLNVIRQASASSEVFFDPTAMMKHAGKLDLDLRVMTLPDGQDPDELIRANPDDWRNRVETAKPVADYVIEVGTAHLTLKSSLAEREQTARDLLPILAATENDLQRHANIQQLAMKLRLNERTLIEWAQRRAIENQSVSRTAAASKGESAKQPTAANPAPIPMRSSGNAIERYCLATLLRRPGWLAFVNRRLRQIGTAAKMTLESLSAQDFSQSDYRAIFEMLKLSLTQNEEEPLEFIEQRLPYELRMEVESLLNLPLDRVEQKLSPVLLMDLVHVKKYRQDFMPDNDNDREEVLRLVLEQRTLELRKLRLRRENIELQSLQQDTAQQETALTRAESSRIAHTQRIQANIIGIRHIELALKEMHQLQRER